VLSRLLYLRIGLLDGLAEFGEILFICIKRNAHICIVTRNTMRSSFVRGRAQMEGHRSFEMLYDIQYSGIHTIRDTCKTNSLICKGPI
jgi:hypothetical protein